MFEKELKKKTKFDYKNYNYHDYYESNKLKKAIDKLNIVGKSIKKIELFGYLEFFDKQSMVNHYNNNFRKKDEFLRKKVFEDDFPLDMEWSRYLNTPDPIIITFYDNTQIALNFVDYSKVRLGDEENYTNLKKLNDVNFDYFYSPAYNSKIISYRIVKLSDDNSQRYYINAPEGLNEKNYINYIVLKLENGLELILGCNYIDLISGINKKNTCLMTLRDVKKAVPYFSKLFTTRDKEYAYDEIYLTPKSKKE